MTKSQALSLKLPCAVLLAQNCVERAQREGLRSGFWADKTLEARGRRVLAKEIIEDTYFVFDCPECSITNHKGPIVAFDSIITNAPGRRRGVRK